MEPFSADSLKEAFHELSAELRWQRIRAHVYIVGGAAMALGFDSRRQTMDVDALIKEGHGPVVEAVRRIGRRRGWPDAWLNEEAVSAIPRGKDGRAKTVYGDPHLLVTAASTEHLGLKSAREVFDLHDEAFPYDPPKRHSFRDARDILKGIM